MPVPTCAGCGSWSPPATERFDARLWHPRCLNPAHARLTDDAERHEAVSRAAWGWTCYACGAVHGLFIRPRCLNCGSLRTNG